MPDLLQLSIDVVEELRVRFRDHQVGQVLSNVLRSELAFAVVHLYAPECLGVVVHEVVVSVEESLVVKLLLVGEKAQLRSRGALLLHGTHPLRSLSYGRCVDESGHFYCLEFEEGLTGLVGWPRSFVLNLCYFLTSLHSLYLKNCLKLQTQLSIQSQCPNS